MNDLLRAPPRRVRQLARRLPLTRRQVQIALGLVWLLDGALQFQRFMYSQGFITQVIEPSAQGQPGFIGHPILSAAHFAGRDLTLWNTLFALVQVAIGLGLLWRRTVRPALVLSFAWAFVVWWFGEGFGGILTGTASPLTGAPGGVLLYGLIGLLVWPTDRADERSAADGGPIGERGALVVWSALWMLSAVLWCLNANTAPGSIHDALIAAAGSSPHWLASWETSVAHAAGGHGEEIAIVLAVLSELVALSVWTRGRTQGLALGIVLSLAYWVLGQSLGGLTTGMATDPNAGLLFVLLALTLLPHRLRRPTASRGTPRSRVVLNPSPRALRGRITSITSITSSGGLTMKGNITRRRGALAGLAATGVALGVSACGGSGVHEATFKVTAFETSAPAKTVSTAPMEGMAIAPTTATGEVHLVQDGDHLTGWRSFTGLVPFSRHASHIHGPDGQCSPGSKQSPNMAVVLPDVVANAKGDSYSTINVIVHQEVVGAGYYVVVHEYPTPKSLLSQIGSAPASPAFMQTLSKDPAILCGDVTSSTSGVTRS